MQSIGVVNESNLHRSLKKIYSNFDSKTEVQIGNYICDIVNSDGSIVEIQTSNLSSIKNKIQRLLKNQKIKIVFPIIENNYIRTFTEKKSSKVLEKKLLQEETFIQKSFRKSPKHENLFSFFKEITSFYFLLDHTNLELDLLFVDIETIKIDDKKGRSPHKLPRIADRKLLKINKLVKIKSLKFLLEKTFDALPEKFSRNDIKKLSTKKDASFTIWILKKCNAIKFCEKKDKNIFYQKNI